MSRTPRVQVRFSTPVPHSVTLAAWLLAAAEATEPDLRMTLMVDQVAPRGDFVHVHLRVILHDEVRHEEAAQDLTERFNVKPWLTLRSHTVEAGGGRLQWFEARAQILLE